MTRQAVRQSCVGTFHPVMGGALSRALLSPAGALPVVGASRCRVVLRFVERGRVRLPCEYCDPVVMARRGHPHAKFNPREGRPTTPQEGLEDHHSVSANAKIKRRRGCSASGMARSVPPCGVHEGGGGGIGGHREEGSVLPVREQATRPSAFPRSPGDCRRLRTRAIARAPKHRIPQERPVIVPSSLGPRRGATHA